MALYVSDLEITDIHYCDKTISAVYLGSDVIWQLGNFFTEAKEVFLTQDRNVFEAAE